MPRFVILEHRDAPDDLLTVVGHRRDVVKEGKQAVVVFLRDGIDLVVVAPCTIHRQTQKGLAGRCHDVVQPIKSRL